MMKLVADCYSGLIGWDGVVRVRHFTDVGGARRWRSLFVMTLGVPSVVHVGTVRDGSFAGEWRTMTVEFVHDCSHDFIGCWNWGAVEWVGDYSLVLSQRIGFVIWTDAGWSTWGLFVFLCLGVLWSLWVFGIAGDISRQ